MNRILTPGQVERILAVTDALCLDRDAVVIPMVATDSPEERVLPDGKLLLRPPAGETFDGWFAGLADRLDNLPLFRTPRAS